MDRLTTFLRYPGSKRRMLDFLFEHLPSRSEISGRFIEPFVGGGAVFFSVKPRTAVLGDLNSELIDLYEGIRQSPKQVWRLYRSYPSTKAAYKQIRRIDTEKLTIAQRAARSLYLNRTCFKGMWRHNQRGQFNIGYGGQDRRWAIERKDLISVSKLLRRAALACRDFEELIAEARPSDYLFMDPPYRPGEREQLNAHYGGRQFLFADHMRLARSLQQASKKGIPWGLTISDHPDILKLYRGNYVQRVPTGTGRQIGVLVPDSGEALITNVR